MTAEIPTFGYILYFSACHDTFIFALSAQAAEVRPFFSLGQFLCPVGQQSHDMLIIFRITGYFKSHGCTGKDLFHDMLKLSSRISRFRSDPGGNPADKFIIRKFTGIAESFYWGYIRQNAVHDQRMSPAESIHVPSRFGFFHQFNETVAIGKLCICRNFPQQTDQFRQILTQYFCRHFKDRHVACIIFTIGKSGYGVIDATGI